MESQLFTSGGGSVPNKTAAITITILVVVTNLFL